MKQLIFILLTLVIVITAVILDIYLIIDVVKSIINDTKTIWQLTFEIFTILIVVPLCSKGLIYILFLDFKTFYIIKLWQKQIK